MPDKTYAKFILNNETYLDLTGDTVDSSSLLSGYTAHDRSGAQITGSFDPSVYVLKAGDTMTGTLNLPTLNLTGTTEEGYDNETTVILNKISLSKICTELPDEEPPYPIKLVSTIDNSESMHTNYYGNIARTDLAKRSGIHFNSKVIGEADEENNPPTWEMFSESDIILGNEYFNNVFEDNDTGTTLGPFVRPHFSLEYNSGVNSSLNLEEEKIDDDDYTYTQKTSYFNKLSYPIFGDAGYTDVTLETYDNGSLCISTGSKTEIYNSENPAHENKYYTNYGDIRLTAISPKRFGIVNIDSNGYVYRAIEMGDSGSVTSPNGYIRINGTDIRQGLPFLYKIWSDDFNYSIAANTNLANKNLVKLRTYTCNSTNTVSTLTNKPSDLTKPFMMYAMSPVLTTHNTPTSGSTALYMMRKIIDSDGNEWNQSVSGTYASKTFGSWKKMATTDDLSSYLPLTGGTLTGNLTISSTDASAGASRLGALVLGNSTPSSEAGSSYGRIMMYSESEYNCTIDVYGVLTDYRSLYLPDKNGTLAVTSDLYSQNLYSKNLLSKDMFIQGSLSSSAGADTAALGRLRSIYIPVKSSTTYSLSTGSTAQIYEIHEFNSSKTFIQYTAPNAVSASITTTSTTKFIKILVHYTSDSYIPLSALENVQMNEGSTLASYTAYMPNIDEVGLYKPYASNLGYRLIQDNAFTIVNNSDLNNWNYIEPGQYAMNSNAGAQSLSNCPTQYAFNMRVENAVSYSYGEEVSSTKYRVRFITDILGNQYTQYVLKEGGSTSALNFGTWNKTITSADSVTELSSNGNITTSASWAYTGKSITIPSSGWWAIDAWGSYTNHAPVAIAIVRDVGTYYYELSYSEFHWNYDKTVSYLLTSCVGNFDSSSVIKLFARYAGASTNDVGIRAKKLH